MASGVLRDRVLFLNINNIIKLNAQYPAAGFHITASNGHAEGNVPKPTKISAMKRGTGGRSSFSGVVATVFGNSGCLGRNVVNKLGKIGSQVMIPYRGDHYDALRLKLCGDLGQILFCPFHLKDEHSLRKAMKYSNVVINLIGKDHETGNFPFEEVHVKGARNIARIAKELGVEKLIHVSALNVVERPKPVILKNGSQFLASKWRGEEAVIEEFPEATIFRPSDMFGQGDRFTTYYGEGWRYLWKKMPFWDNGWGIIKQPVSASDVAEGIVNAIFDPAAVGNTYQAIGPDRFELPELYDFMARVMRKESAMGYKKINMRYSPVFQLQVSFVEKIFAKYPKISWERVEREHVNDTVIRGMPTLMDLGVKLTRFEDTATFDLFPYKAHGYYKEEFGEFEPPAPPVYAPVGV